MKRNQRDSSFFIPGAPLPQNTSAKVNKLMTKNPYRYTSTLLPETILPPGTPRSGGKHFISNKSSINKLATVDAKNIGCFSGDVIVDDTDVFSIGTKPVAPESAPYLFNEDEEEESEDDKLSSCTTTDSAASGIQRLSLRQSSSKGASGRAKKPSVDSVFLSSTFLKDGGDALAGSTMPVSPSAGGASIHLLLKPMPPTNETTEDERLRYLRMIPPKLPSALLSCGSVQANPLIDFSVPNGKKSKKGPRSVRMQLRVIQRYISQLQYNFLPTDTFFCLKKNRPLKRIYVTVKEFISVGLPIRCLEATFMGLFLTHFCQGASLLHGIKEDAIKGTSAKEKGTKSGQHGGNKGGDDKDIPITMRCLERIPLSLNSVSKGKLYRHIVLAVRVPASAAPHGRDAGGRETCGRTRYLYGALGLSRRELLMYKPLIFPSLVDLIIEYQRSYHLIGHKLQDVALGLPTLTPHFHYNHPAYFTSPLGPYNTGPSSPRGQKDPFIPANLYSFMHSIYSTISLQDRDRLIMRTVPSWRYVTVRLPLRQQAPAGHGGSGGLVLTAMGEVVVAFEDQMTALAHQYYYGGAAALEPPPLSLKSLVRNSVIIMGQGGAKAGASFCNSCTTPTMSSPAITPMKANGIVTPSKGGSCMELSGSSVELFSTSLYQKHAKPQTPEGQSPTLAATTPTSASNTENGPEEEEEDDEGLGELGIELDKLRQQCLLCYVSPYHPEGLYTDVPSQAVLSTMVKASTQRQQQYYCQDRDKQIANASIDANGGTASLAGTVSGSLSSTVSSAFSYSACTAAANGHGSPCPNSHLHGLFSSVNGNPIPTNFQVDLHDGNKIDLATVVARCAVLQACLLNKIPPCIYVTTGGSGDKEGVEAAEGGAKRSCSSSKANQSHNNRKSIHNEANDHHNSNAGITTNANHNNSNHHTTTSKNASPTANHSTASRSHTATNDNNDNQKNNINNSFSLPVAPVRSALIPKASIYSTAANGTTSKETAADKGYCWRKRLRI